MARNTGKLTEYVIKRRRQKDDELKYDFMPSLLEIIERPAHMAGKVIVISITLLLIFTILYASKAKLDVVVSGQGFVTGSNKTLNINAEYGGKISALNVNVGDEVKAGDILLTLDSQDVKVKRDLVLYELERAKIEKEICTLFEADSATVIEVTKYDGKHTDFVNSLVLENDLYNKQLEMAYNTEMSALQRKTELIQRIAELDQMIMQYENSLMQYDKQIEAMSIVAITDGYVAELNVTGVGESVSANATVMTIIPDQNEFVFESYIADKDIGFVSVDDEVMIKLSAYSFSEYGAVYGKIKEISKNSKFVMCMLRRFLLMKI